MPTLDYTPTLIKFDTEARASILRGLETMSKAVGATMGARGKQVLIEQSQGNFYPKFTMDGVSVSRCIKPEDKFENLGAQILRQVANKQVEECGDGTTTAIVLAAELVRGGFSALSAGMDAQSVKRGMDKAVAAICEQLTKLAKPIATAEEIEQIATISAHGDAEVGKAIAKASNAVGKDGVVTIEHSKIIIGIDVEIVDGCRIGSGYLTPLFSNTESLECVLENPLVLLTDQTLDKLADINPALNLSLQLQRPLLIVSDEIANEVLHTILYNKINGQLRVCCIKLPDAAREELLGDLAVMLGGNIMTLKEGRETASVIQKDFGLCRKIVVTNKHTDIIGGTGNKATITKRAAGIRSGIKKATEKHAKQALQDRLAALTAGVAVIRVGGTTEAAAKELVDRVDDALHAVKCAHDEGIVPGGGAALLHAVSDCDPVVGTSTAEQLGATLAFEACEAPFARIMTNAGKGKVVTLVARTLGDDKTYDVVNGNSVDAYKSGIIDPCKVVRSALQNAASVAGLLITTECILVEKLGDK